MGYLNRESILMSKHWMDKVWSWDHAFNALAVAPGLLGVALDQFLTPFDHQDASGALPDSVTHSEVLYNYVKPPIHGWALGGTPQAGSTRPELRRVQRDLPGPRRLDSVLARLPPGRRATRSPYYQHGNDSGWDNSTTFDRSRVIESPDLAAFMVVQLDTLIGLADELEIGAARDLGPASVTPSSTALCGQLWDGERFVARDAASGEPSASTSLLNLLPIVAAERLPPEMRDRLAAHIRDHLTEFGPATEIPGTEHYESDGYWRGPDLGALDGPDRVRAPLERIRRTCRRREPPIPRRSASGRDSRRTSTLSPVRVFGTGRTRGPRARTSSSRARPRRAARRRAAGAAYAGDHVRRRGAGPHRRTRAPARDRPQERPAHRVLPARRGRRGREPPRPDAPHGQGEGAVLRDLRKRRRGRTLPHLPRPAAHRTRSSASSRSPRT